MSKRKGKHNPLDEALAKIRLFLQSLATESKDSSGASPVFRDSDIVIGGPNGEGLFLTGDTAQQYRKHLRILVDAVGDEDRIGRKTIEKLFQNAVLAGFDHQARQSGLSLEELLDQALVKLKDSLTVTPRLWQIDQQVAGIASDGLPVKVGRVEFLVFDLTQLNSFYLFARDTQASEGAKAQLREDVSNALLDKVIARFTVSTIDAVAAKFVALKQVRLTIDVLNYYSDFFYVQGHVKVSLQPDISQTEEMVIATTRDPKPDFHVNESAIRPLQNMSLTKLIHSDPTRTGFVRVNEILTRQVRSRMEDRLLAALQWAGRATVDAEGQRTACHSCEHSALFGRRGYMPKFRPNKRRHCCQQIRGCA